MRKCKGSRIALMAAKILCAVLLTLSFVFSAFFCVLNHFLSSREDLVAAIVDEAYVEQALLTAKEAMADQSLYYGIPEEVFISALDSKEIARVGTLSVESFWASILEKSEYVYAAYDASLFEAALDEYFALHPDKTIRAEELDAIVQESASLVSSAAAPVSNGVYRRLVQPVAARLPQGWPDLLRAAFWICLVVTLVLLVLLFFLSGRLNGLLWPCGALFCGATLLFVPSFFLFSSVELSDLALSRGVLMFLVSTTAQTLGAAYRLSATLVFVFGTLTLLFAVFFTAHRSLKAPVVVSESVKSDGASPTSSDDAQKDPADGNKDEAPSCGEDL